MRIYTVGHSTRSLDELFALLRASGVRQLADIRRYPGSRRYPHFSRESLAAELPKHGIAYVHMPELGGRRAPAKDSPNDALRNAQFRGANAHVGSYAVCAAAEPGAQKPAARRALAGSVAVVERDGRAATARSG